MNKRDQERFEKRVWRAYNEFPEHTRFRTKRIAMKLGVSPDDVERVIFRGEPLSDKDLEPLGPLREPDGEQRG